MSPYATTSLEYALYALGLGSKSVQAPVTVPQAALGQNALTYYLHQQFTAEPFVEEDCAAHNTERRRWRHWRLAHRERQYAG